jgi:hypothetical protein
LLLYVDLLHTQPVSHPRQEEHTCVRFEVCVPWVMPSWRFVGSYQRIGRAYCLHIHFTLKTEAAWASKTLIIIYKIIQCYNSDEHDLGTRVST